MKLLTALVALLAVAPAGAQRITLTPAEQAIEARLAKLRQTPDTQRGGETRRIAVAIEKLPASNGKVLLANMLGSLSTEGDFGMVALQAVADALAGALRETPQPDANGGPDFAYVELAELVRYEHVKVSLDDPHFKAALASIDAMHADQAKADFTLQDIAGKSWTRSALKGKIVLVNFWATWCPPCRKEMPDLEALYRQYASRGLVVLAISDEPLKTVQPFIAKQGYTFPVLLDPGRKVNGAYHIQGIPNSFIYDRKGRLAAQSIDMRTRGQFLKLLAKAGLREGPTP